MVIGKIFEDHAVCTAAGLGSASLASRANAYQKKKCNSKVIVSTLRSECNIVILFTGKMVINEYARKHNLNVFDGLELRNSTRQYGL